MTEALRAQAPPAPVPATLRDALGRAVEAGEVERAMVVAVRRLEDPDASPLEVDDELLALVAERRERYLDAGWTWRR